MDRVPEPELMNEPAQALAYAQADFETPHQLFIEMFQQKFSDISINDAVLDLGCGPCDISRRFSRAYPHCTIHGVDGAPHMLQHAKTLNERQQFADRIKLIEGILPEATLPQRFYHTIISNSLLHHLHNPFVLWKTIQQHAQPFANIFIMDLIRPDSVLDAKHIVEVYAANEADILQRDFYHSLLAAFTVGEIQRQLEDMGMGTLNIETITDRHCIIYGTLS